MQRRIYTAFLKSGKEQEAIQKLTAGWALIEKSETEALVKNPEKAKSLQGESSNRSVENASLFRYGRQIFLYFEFAGMEIDPDDIFVEASDFLESWPDLEGFRHWIMMVDIFHYQAPQSPEEWRRKTQVERPVGRVVWLKPEMIASYIYYHYQYQEEKPGDGDKYGIIGIHGDLLFFYGERPTYLETPSYKGKLKTKNTPANWSELMGRHFMEWADAKSAGENWRYAEVLLTYGLIG